MAIDKYLITGLVLAGGRGSRMGGVDKGLQPFNGKPLVAHVIARLRRQVGPLLINANRNHAAYAAFGLPVVADATDSALGDFAGPLAGMLAGLQICTTPYLVTVPCDSPALAPDLVARLAQGLLDDAADIAIAASLENRADSGGARVVQVQPVFCLMKASLAASLAAYLQNGERKIDRWAGAQRSVQVLFDNADEFFNANTLADLARQDETSP